MLWPKIIHTRNLITKNNFCGSKIPLLPITFLTVPKTTPFSLKCPLSIKSTLLGFSCQASTFIIYRRYQLTNTESSRNPLWVRVAM